MVTFVLILVATHLLLCSPDRVSKPCKREVRVTFETQGGLYWAYLFSDRLFGTQTYKASTCCCRGHPLTSNPIPDSGGLVDIMY